ncbi:MAG: hypothetical protein US57_C0015G0007 [Candidatus Moranbacteria bacterium GW2011_GWC2_37_73]|nr:MAG: hypothetical protein UR95_C0006G0009 [Parcubacteria group bacterium GW2011_GWC1_36_108]KKQ39317.1 MAG: hypothetical protein US57_C0015G0007 [Candidatus Moranbacteria bacterium GW2011_GWC2_37_73]
MQLELLSLSSWLFGIFGIVLSIYFGIRFRYPGKITLYKESVISLFSDITKNLDKLSMIYEGNPISPNLYLFKGVLTNSGNKDIKSNEKIYFNLLDGDKWIDVKIISTSLKVDASIKIESNTCAVVSIGTGLFRCGESIGLETLIETSKQRNEKEINNIFSIEHRILDTQKADIQDMPKKISGKWQDHIMHVIMPVAGIIFLFLFNFVNANNAKIEWHFENNKNEKIIALGKIRLDGTIKLNGIQYGNEIKKYDEVSDLSTILKKEKLELFATKDKTSEVFMNILIIIGYIMYPISRLGRRYYQHLKGKKIRIFLEAK